MVRIIVAAVLLLGFGPLQEEKVPGYTQEDIEALIQEAEYGRQFDRYQAFINSCMYTPYSCINVSLPKVRYVAMNPGLLGYYNGSDTIYIRRGMRGIQRKEVLMHESVHYLQKQVGGLEIPGYAEPICRAEAEAFAVVDAWLGDIGLDRYKVGPNWWEPYTYCHKWYDPKYPNYAEEDSELWGLEHLTL